MYGPGEPEGRLLPSLLFAAGNTGPIPLTTGEQQRDFTFVDDAVEGMLRLGSLARVEGAIVNLCTGTLRPVHEFVRCAAGVLGLESGRLAFGALPTRPEEMQHDPVSVALLEVLTEWRPATSLEEGVRRTVVERGRSGT